MITRTAALNGVTNVSDAVRVKKLMMAFVVVLSWEAKRATTVMVPSTRAKTSAISHASNFVPKTDHHCPRHNRSDRRNALAPRMSSIMSVGTAKVEHT